MMANYVNLQAAIDAGTTNMTVNPNCNNVKNDDSTDTIASGITWFYFNSVQVTNLYVSGNSWVGFGASSEQLKVNRRDAAVWYEYTETGTIGTYRFLKFRWVGYSAYSATSDANLQQYDVFLLDNGQIYLNWFDVPTSSFDGTNALVCGSATTTFSATAGTACEYTFTPADTATGTGWSLAAGRPNLIVNHNASGSAIYTVHGITGTVASSTIKWTEDKPTGTIVAVSVSTDGSNYSPVTNGGQFLSPGSYDNTTAYIKVELTTTDATLTPTVSSLHLALQTAEDTYSIILEMEPLQRFESAAGDITVAYDGLGTLSGNSGAVEAFSATFTPTELAPKPDQNDEEHIEISSITATGTLTEIQYEDAQAGGEHLEIVGITATGVLTHINDI